MDKELKIAFIEVGHYHAGMYLNFIKKTKHKIIAVSDKNKEIAQKIAKEFTCHFYSDYHKLLKKEDIDFVFSFGRHCEMPEIIDSILERGIPLCTEKPITNNAGIMKKLSEKANKKGLFTDVVLPLRFSPIILAIKEFSEKNNIGEIVHCYFRNMAGPIQRYIDWRNKWLLDKKIALGGSFINEGPHYIDLFRYLTKEETKFVYAGMNNCIYGKSIEDNSSVILETASGKRGVIEICYGYPTDRNWRDFACVINTTNYLFTLIDIEKPRIFKLEIRCRKNNKVEITNLLKYNQDVYNVFLEEMLKRYLNNQPCIIPFNYYYGIVKVLDAIYKSVMYKKVIQI